MKLNSSNKYRMNRAGLFLRKNVFSGRFFVRNTIIALIFATVVGTPIIVLGNNTGDKQATVEASEPVYEINISEADMIDENSLTVIKSRIDAEASVKLSSSSWLMSHMYKLAFLKVSSSGLSLLAL